MASADRIMQDIQRAIAAIEPVPTHIRLNARTWSMISLALPQEPFIAGVYPVTLLGLEVTLDESMPDRFYEIAVRCFITEQGGSDDGR